MVVVVAGFRVQEHLSDHRISLHKIRTRSGAPRQLELAPPQARVQDLWPINQANDSFP